MLLELSLTMLLQVDPAVLPKENGTVKNLVKDAISGPEAKSKGPDVSKMPFTQNSIKTVLAAYQPMIQGCYEEQLAMNGKKPAEGMVKAAFVITAEGLVSKARVDKKSTTLKNAKLHDCVVAVLSTMEFPKPPDGKPHPIEIPFNLKAIQ
jgi:hypothetical protein